MFQSPVSFKTQAQTSNDNVSMAVTVEMATSILMFVFATILAFMGQWVMAAIGATLAFVAWSFFYSMLRTFKSVQSYFDQSELSLAKDIRIALDVSRRSANEINDTYRGNAMIRMFVGIAFVLIPMFMGLTDSVEIALGLAYVGVACVTAVFAALSANKVANYGPTKQVILQTTQTQYS